MTLISTKGYGNVWILTISNALAACVAPMMVLVGSLVGRQLAPSEDWATFPIALMVVGTAISILPATRSMQKLGRKKAFWLFMGLGFVSCWLAGYSLQLQSFLLFCIASLLLGATNAALQQTRFAAMECVTPEAHSTAASIVMCGGIIAAILGPELAVRGINLTSVEYQGSFWLTSICLVVAAAILAFYKPAAITSAKKTRSNRPGLELLRNPAFCLALTAGAVAFVIMSFVMTSTPISMHHLHGHSLADTKWVIQSHIAAMFLPSLIAPLLFRQFGIRGMMLIGLLCYCATVAIGWGDVSVSGFWLQLVLLGIGWNFLFVAGTVLLPSTYREGEAYKAQTINDMTVFSMQALASLSAGWAINLFSWRQMLVICLVPILLMLAVLVWEHWAEWRNNRRNPTSR